MVPVVDLSRHAPDLVEAQLANVAAILRRGSVLLGPETDSFEAEFAAWAGVPGAVAVASGASAIQLVLAAMGIGPGDEVVVPAFTAVPTASAVCAVGAVPVFADVDRATAALDPASLDAVRTDRTKAVIVVHLYGRPAELPDTDLPVVEDAAQATGALDRHDRSAAVAYSFYPTKNLGGIGDGGAVVSADTALLERVRRRRVHGMTAQYVHEDVSQNFRMSEVEAAWLRLGLPRLAAGNVRRRAIVARYREAAPSLRWHADHAHHVHHLCVARFERRDDVRAALADAGVGTGVHYPRSLGQQPAYTRLARHATPEADAWAAECVTLPCFPAMTDDEIELVATALERLPEDLTR